MARPDYDSLLDWLRERFGDDLRWVASFDSDRFDYRIRYVRDDLRTELTEQRLDVIVHRSMAVYNRRHLEDVYNYLGAAECLVVQHDRATAVHLYLDGATGVVVKLSTDAEVTVPTFREEATARLFPDPDR
jgi:hypothetical protein